jgi:heptosyltransferase-2
MDRFVYLIAIVLVSAIRRLPISLCFRIGMVLGMVLYGIQPQYRRLARKNLRRAFGREMSSLEIRKLTRSHFRTLGANLLSALCMPAMSEKEILKTTTLEGMEILDEALAKGKGVVLAISHIGNWELFAQLAFLRKETRFGTVFQAIRNRYINDFINRDRSRLGVQTFDRRRGFAGPMKLLRGGGVVGVLVDQHAGDGGLWTPLFNNLASTSPLAATLALRAEAEILPVAITTVGIARWKVTIDPPLSVTGKDANELTCDINFTLENQIRRSPKDWFWVHERWKTPRPNFLMGSARRGMFLPPDVRLEPFRILVRSSNWLGDAVMSMPAVAALKRGRPDARITVLTPAKLRDLWVAMPEVDEILAIEPHEHIGQVAYKIRTKDYRVAVLFPNSLRAALEAFLGRVPRRVGYPGHARKWLVNQMVPVTGRSGPPKHHAERYLAMVRRAGGSGEATFRYRPPRITESRIIFGVCPGAEYGPAKRWPVEAFRAAMEEVSRHVDCHWVVVGVAKDRALAGELIKGFTGSVEDLTGKTSLRELMRRMRYFTALLTNDTGTMHLAAYLGLPSVAVFGSTEPALTSPLGDFHRVLRHQVECSPCFLRNCPLDFRCMQGVKPEQAAEAVLDIARKNPLFAEKELTRAV